MAEILYIVGMTCYALAAVIVIVVVVGVFFNKDICEDIENDKVNRHYNGEK